ncbi:E3 ubiquitin-protein ligase Topors-like [Heliangelus exortis]|uniref:E3 ubiquitin-protein ligase Topors-like n=1 Tax=Heliangelus exortis TaxID=472823 RepID=UPI003A91CD51
MGSESPSPAPSSPPQPVGSRDTPQEERCPICLDSWEDPSFLLPCLHRFCYGCILRWVGSKPECPLCKRRVASILHSVRGDEDFEEVFLTPAPRHPEIHRPPRPGTPQARAAESRPVSPVGGLHPDTWATLFDEHPALFRRFMPWVREQLGLLLAEDPSSAALFADLIMVVLGLFGLEEGSLLRLLQDGLGDRAAPFVADLIEVVVQRCGREAHRLLGLDTRREDEGQEPPDGPRTAPPGSRDGAQEEEHPTTSRAALGGSASSPPDVPVPTQGQEEDQGGDPQAAAPGPSRASQGRDRSSRGRPRRALKRRPSGCQESCQPQKRPRRHQQ